MGFVTARKHVGIGARGRESPKITRKRPENGYFALIHLDSSLLMNLL